MDAQDLTTSRHKGREAWHQFAHDLREALSFPSPLDSDLPRLRDYPFRTPSLGGR